jgi:hypothetical protein
MLFEIFATTREGEICSVSLVCCGNGAAVYAFVDIFCPARVPPLAKISQEFV